MHASGGNEVVEAPLVPQGIDVPATGVERFAEALDADGTGLAGDVAEGEDMSWDAVKEKLKVIIDNEDKNNPLNDDEIVDKLKEQGIDLARRTVAKYRKILNIPTARQRKEY